MDLFGVAVILKILRNKDVTTPFETFVFTALSQFVALHRSVPRATCAAGGFNEMEMEMKKALLASVAVVFIASPAFAQSYDPDVGTGNQTQWFDNGDRLHPNADAAPYGAYNQFPAYAPRVHVRRGTRMIDGR